MTHCLVLRLAAPLQSWGGQSQFNRRDTLTEPTKSGVVGLLAAAQGLRREDPIEALLGLTLGVRTDRAGTILRDYHTVSTLDGSPLPSAQVTAKGIQKRTSPPKPTHVTTRFYLQDAAFVAVVSGPTGLLTTLAAALHHPAFPLALGRRSCPPTQPLLLPHPTNGSPDATGGDRDATGSGPDTSWAGAEADLWPGDVLTVLGHVPWQAPVAGRGTPPARLAVTIDDPTGDDLRTDVPLSFDPRHRGYTTRTVSHHWVTPPGCAGPDPAGQPHDPFALLGW